MDYGMHLSQTSKEYDYFENPLPIYFFLLIDIVDTVTTFLNISVNIYPMFMM